MRICIAIATLGDVCSIGYCTNRWVRLPWLHILKYKIINNLDKAKFRHELGARISVGKAPYHIVAEMTIGSYYGTIPSANGNGVIADYDRLAILGCEKNNHLMFFIGDFQSDGTWEVRVEAPNMLAFIYNLSNNPQIIFQKNQSLYNQIQNHPQGQEVKDVMMAIYVLI